MRLKSAAKFFDTCPVYDAYTGALLFKVQTSTFLESSKEGSTAARRVISLEPSLNVPAHNCILANDQLLVVGASNPDEWQGSAIRKAYWTKLVTDNFSLLTPGQAALQSVGSPLFGSKAFLKVSVNTQTDAEYDPYWAISVSKNSTVSRGYFLKSANTLYRVRANYVDLDGFMTCEADEVDVQSTYVSFSTTNNYNPVSDSYQAGIVTTTGILLDLSKSFVRTSGTDIQFVAGDMTLIVSSQALIVNVGQEFSLQDTRYKGRWRVISVLQEQDSWNLHVRRL